MHLSVGQVTSVDFSKDGDWIRSNCEGGQLFIWDSNKGKHQVRKTRCRRLLCFVYIIIRSSIGFKNPID